MAVLLLVPVFGTDAKLEIINSKIDLLVGDDHLLLCKAGREGEITWQKDGEDVDEEGKVSMVDESSSRLFIKKAKMADAGKYTCQCEYEGGYKDASYTQVYVYEGPSFGATPTYHEFLVGQDAVVPCLVSGKPGVDVRWRRDKDEIQSYGSTRVRQIGDNSLSIGTVKREDAGNYVCCARIRGRPISKELSISVVVNAPPTVRLKEEVKRVMAGPATNVSLLCLVDGLPKPNISWTMPVKYDPSHHHFNSDRSELIIKSVARGDYGEYVCTAKNKLAESSATIMLHVSEAPEVYVSAERQSVFVGETVSVSCNVSGHPQPQLHWINKHSGYALIPASGRVRVLDGVLVIDKVAPSDGGLYSCMAVSPSGNASRDVALYTQPGPPQSFSVSPGSAMVLFSLKTPPINGGTPITSYTLQWRLSGAEKWEETTVLASDPLAITSLKPYTSYIVRLAAINAVGQGTFSDTQTVQTQGIREPDSPVLSFSQMKVEDNTFSVPVQQLDDGGTPLMHFNVQYRQDKKKDGWKQKQLPPDATSLVLTDLSFGSDYHLEVVAVNMNGSSNAAVLNFTVPLELAKVNKPSVTKGGVVGIVMVIFLVLLLAVDATCCYTNHCGLLMFVAVKLFGQKVPGLKTLEEGEGTTNGELKLKGLATPRHSIQQQQAGVQSQTKEGGQNTEVTCDKAPLTKYEKTPSNGDLPTTDA
ncbi:neural cell adhesion molecule 1 [Polymixia lowei]